MSRLTCFVLLQFLITYADRADSRTQDYVSSGDGRLPSKCELYAGKICSKFVGQQSVFVKPLEAQATKEMQMTALVAVFPDYISSQCQPYAFQALCLSAFPPCDLTVNYPKPRMFCQDECKALEQFICANEFNVGRTKYMTSFVPPCWKLPSVNSPEHKKCVRLNLTIDKPEFKLGLKNKTVTVGETVVFKCKVKPTDIPPTITWYKDGKIIPAGHAFYKTHWFRYSSRMKMRRIRAQDFGRYTCHASNYLTNVSTHSWLTVLPHAREQNLSRHSNNKSSCSKFGATLVCGEYLQGKQVFLDDPKKIQERELMIQSKLSGSNMSAECYKIATAAWCYYMFPSCIKNGVTKPRLCKEDCHKAKRKFCKNQFPEIFPECSGLPKRKGRRGRRCENPMNIKVTVVKPTTAPTTCGKYKGNGFCGKYVRNDTIYFYSKAYQYDLEKKISASLKDFKISDNCSRFGIPAICYHLFPICSHNKRSSRLCQEECTRVKTDVCRGVVSMISKPHLQMLFPECPNLPRANTKEGAYCVDLGISRKIKGENIPGASKNVTLYEPSHKCYNKSGATYLGTVNLTVFGNFCISWNERRPSYGWKHNFCRNPGGKAESPWCYVSKRGRREYCAVKRCHHLSTAFHKSGVESTSLGRTIYVVIAIVAVILLGCITVIVYWKVQNSKESIDNSPQNSATPFAKCSSSQLIDVRESTSVQSFVLNEKLTRGRVKYISVISEGKFFKVFKGVLINENGKPNMDIVIKTLSEDASSVEKETFRRETRLLCPLQHMNILGLLGLSPGEGMEFVVFEYLSEMNLHQFLKQSETNPPEDILMDIASQIANGMKYLSEFSYVHGDLAARNCFISANDGNVNVKISMLGIGSHKYSSDYDWLHQDSSLFPIRWMSPEALDSLVLTSENDIWSFGVLLWEIFSYGLQPYQQYNNVEVTDKIRSLELLQCPANSSQAIRGVMNNCWTVAPSSRPNFGTIYDVINSQRHDHVIDDVIQEVQV